MLGVRGGDIVYRRHRFAVFKARQIIWMCIQDWQVLWQGVPLPSTEEWRRDEARACVGVLHDILFPAQLHGRWRVKDAKLQPLHAEARRLLQRFDRWTAVHVPRAQNSAADALCNEAIDRALAGGPASVVRRPDGKG